MCKLRLRESREKQSREERDYGSHCSAPCLEDISKLQSWQLYRDRKEIWAVQGTVAAATAHARGSKSSIEADGDGLK